MHCPECGNEMNHHANKILMDNVDGEGGGNVVEGFSCPHCGHNAARVITQELLPSE
jgi:predicted RNA-binding Zn-ribbon protein involved in translation (DUF1610 family)